MNITNKGASYEYIPGDEVHDSSSWAIGLSGLDLRSTDAFAYSLAKSIASAGASAATGYLASKAGLGGFASTLAASLAGSYVANSMDAQLAPPEAKSTKIESKLPQISTASTVSFDHNGNGFKAVNVSMDGNDLNDVIRKIKENIFAEALDEQQPTEIVVKRIETIEQDIATGQKDVEKTAEDIISLDATLKTKSNSSNATKVNAIVDCLKTLARKQAELETKSEDNIVKKTALQTQLEIITEAKQQYLRDLVAVEQAEKIRHADKAVNDRKLLIWTQLDDQAVIDVSQIKVSDEASIRQASNEKVARDFQRQRDIIEAEYRANVRFAQGDGFVVDIPIEYIDLSDSPMISVCTNSPEERLERLRQEELMKCGESAPQRVARFIPVLGTVIDHHYDRISEREFFSTLGIDSICLAATTSKAIGSAKQASTARFARNLNLNYAANFNTSLRQRTILAFEEAGILTKDGLLTERAIKEAKKLPLNIGNQTVKQNMQKINQNGDWGKYATKSISIIDGQSAEVHFYMDAKTGQTYFGHDFKVKVNNDAGVSIFKQPKIRKDLQ